MNSGPYDMGHHGVRASDNVGKKISREEREAKRRTEVFLNILISLIEYLFRASSSARAE